MPRCPVLLAASCLLAAAVDANQPLFDSHLHYNAENAERYTPAEIVAKFNADGIKAAAVTSRPPELVLRLYEEAPGQVLPLLGVYRTLADKQRWTEDPELPARVERALDQGPWRGVGELHLFADQRRSPVFERIADLATARGLPLQLHCDPAVIDAVFERLPEATVIWAHAGAFPYPPLLRDYLRRYPNLYLDLSVRDQRIAPFGQLDPQWELLFFEYPDRFLVGVDTYRTSRWDHFGDVVGLIRGWLGELPDDVARSLAYDNAARLFGYESTD